MRFSGDGFRQMEAGVCCSVSFGNADEVSRLPAIMPLGKLTVSDKMTIMTLLLLLRTMMVASMLLLLRVSGLNLTHSQP